MSEMLDFLEISYKTKRGGGIEIHPSFLITKSKDLMIRGGSFYAIYDQDSGLWNTDEYYAIDLIDQELKKYAEENFKDRDNVHVLYLCNNDTGSIDKWHKYVQKQCPDHYHDLDKTLLFANSKTKRTNYATKMLPYSLEDGSREAYDELMSVLYSPEERRKIEWAIGSIVNGDSKKIQKFVVLYGSAGTGKSTVINIIDDLFEGYCAHIRSKSIGAGNEFSLSQFKNNPLVALEHDGDLSRIEDNSQLNSLISHEIQSINEKYKSQYEMRIDTFLFMGTNKPVQITDAKSGLLRRLIDVTPTGNKVSIERYRELKNQIKFELGPIAYHCKEVYEADKDAYVDYVPEAMMSATNDLYNFVLENYEFFSDPEGVNLQDAYRRYKVYCEESNSRIKYSKMYFKEELKSYFESFTDKRNTPDHSTERNRYRGFKTKLFEYGEGNVINVHPGLEFKEQESLFDKECCEFAAQYASDKETPAKKWEKVTTKLKDLDTSKLHYVMVPINHIVIDFDLKDSKGKKSFKKNLEAANKWPKTYAELSKGGEGIHLHYIYDGDPERLARLYEEDIEVKVFTGNSSLRRRLSKCVNNPIAHINSGLPLKREEKKKVVNFDGVKSEKKLRSMIIKALKKEYENIPPYTRPNIDFINKILNDAYDSGMKYDVTDLRPAILDFASKSTHQANECIKIVNKMKFASEECSNIEDKSDEPLVFYDCEVFPNLFVICWKFDGSDNVVRMINPSSSEVEELVKHKLVGFNSKRYDSHILYGRMMGYNNEQLYRLSQKIIEGSKNAMFGEAYNLGYTDIYDFSSKKQSLKKFEIELGLHHQECPLRWDEPVPEDKWDMVADYCCNDVIATEAVFHARKGDFLARQILADLAGGTVNDSTNGLTTKIIFGKEKHPKLIYTDLATGKQY